MKNNTYANYTVSSVNLTASISEKLQADLSDVFLRHGSLNGPNRTDVLLRATQFPLFACEAIYHLGNARPSGV